MEHVVYQSIMLHLEHVSILYSNQHGFMNDSCETQLLFTSANINFSKEACLIKNKHSDFSYCIFAFLYLNNP